LPGWTCSIAGLTQSTILYNVATGSGPNITLFGPPSSPAGANYLLALQSGSGQTAALEQTGMIPLGANSIQFVNQSDFLNNPFFVGSDGLMINGQAVPLVPVSAQNNNWTYAGNISQYAGRTVTIEFYSSAPVPDFSSLTLENITFSSQGVPETGTLALSGLGGLALLSVAQKKRR
jgi:hypothetical protein